MSCLCRKLAIREIQLDKVLSALGLDHKEVTGNRTHARTHTHTRTHTHARTHTCTHTHAHTHTRTHTHIVHTQTHTHTHTHTHTPHTHILLVLPLSLLQFIDLCILLGCDYCDSPRGASRCMVTFGHMYVCMVHGVLVLCCSGIGPKRGVELIQQYKSIDEILKHKSKLPSVSVAVQLHHGALTSPPIPCSTHCHHPPIP